MLRYMLDTNICIYIQKNRPDYLRGRFNRMEGQLCISAVVFGELSFGAEKSSRRDESLAVLDQFIAGLEILAFGHKAAAHYGQIRAELERNGAMIGSLDMLIAAHARSEGLVLVTNNEREFDRITGLMTENWLR
jgi:tRNA(fMet)-specific endonuclease VapC